MTTRRFRALPSTFAALALAALVTSSSFGCKKSEPPPPAAEAPATKAATPIPEGFAFNDFLGESPEAQADGGGGAAAGQPGQDEVRLVEPGAEPRAKLRYELKVGKTERVKVNIKPEVEQVVEGRSQKGPQPGIEFTLAVTPKERDADGGHKIEAKILKLTVAAGEGPEAKELQAMIAPALKSMEGVAAIVTMSSRGSVSDVQFAGASAPPQAAADFLPFIGQAFEMLAAPLPDEPVGEGARWEHVSRAVQDGVPAKMTATMVLKKRAGNAITLDVETKREGKGELSDPRLPEGMTVERSGTGQFVYQLNLDGAPLKVDGAATSVDTIKDPSTNPPRAITTRAKVAQTLTRI